MYRAQLFAAQQLPAYLSSQLSVALKRPVTVGSVSLWPIGAFTVHQVAVAPGEGEKSPPLVADRARIHLSWWDLIFHQRVRLRKLHVYKATVRGELPIEEAAETQTDAAATLRALSDLGLRKIGIHNSAVQLTAWDPSGDPRPVAVTGLDLVANLKGGDFKINGKAGRWSGGGFEASNLSLQADGDASGFRINRSGATFHGGRLDAQGTYVARGGKAALQVTVNDLPIQTLAPEIGIPEEWAVNGNISGIVEIDAVSGELERVDGSVNIARGFIQRSQAVLPWTRAQAKVDWRPDSVVLRGIDVQGNGISLTGDARINGDQDAPFAERPYSATGKLTATRAEAVASLAELLAFSEPVPGNWSVDQASVDFKAHGTVGNLADSAATGRFKAGGLKLPTPGSAAMLQINTVSGDVERGAERLQVRNIRASADGLVAQGDLVVTPERDGAPGSYSTKGKVDFTRLTTLRRQAPDAAFWQWIAPALPSSRGEITFQATGPTSTPEKVTGSGDFRFREFVATLPTGVGEERWNAPIREVRGSMALRNERLAVSDLTLRSDLFQGSGNLTLSGLSNRATPTGTVHLVSDRWQELPPLQARVPKSIAGGTLRIDARLPQGQPAVKNPISGKLTLTGATYRLNLKGKTTTLPLRSASASFEMLKDRVVVPDYQVRSAHFATTGSGSAALVPGSSRWQLHGEGMLSAPDAGLLAATFADNQLIQGGKLNADYVVDAPSDRPADATVRAKVRLRDARPRLPETALPFSNDEARINSLTGTFNLAKGVTRFNDLIWKAPRFQAKADGAFAGGQLDSTFQLSTRQWREIAAKLAETLPVSGGVLTAEGRVRGPLATLAKAPVEGVITLRGARLASDRNASTPVEGGSVDLKADVRGTLERLADSAADGTFALRDIALPPLRKNARPVTVAYANGKFQRDGSRIVLRDLEASAPGARLTGAGELKGVGTGKASHEFAFQASGPSLAAILPAVAPVPGKATGGRFTGSLRISGTAAQRLASLNGQANVVDMEWTPPGQTIPLKIESMSARMSRTGESAVIDQARLKLAGGEASLVGAIKGLGTPAGARHSVRVTWRFEDASAWASRFLPIPGWFTGGTFTGNATIDGNAADPARAASGQFTVADTGFMPPKQFLGGPVRPIQVQSVGSPFTRSGGRTTLSALKLTSSVGNVAGTVSSDDKGNAALRVRGDIERLEALVDLWPGFKDRLRGGSGSLDLVLNGPLRAPRKMEGTALIAGRNGALTVESVDELYAVQPFDELSLSLQLYRDGRVDVKSARMRGPKANLDGKGTIQANNKLHIEGRAWFTEAFTKKLIKPKILWPLAKLIGKRQIKSAFELDGTLQQARLDLGITDSVLWGLAIKKRVPEPLRKIATGDAPIWSTDFTPPAKVAARK
ncbi:MAG: hypothetical protein ACO1SX_17065 [Actinomycetota bacterium]